MEDPKIQKATDSEILDNESYTVLPIALTPKEATQIML